MFRKARLAFFLGSTTLATLAYGPPAMAQQQFSYSIPAGSLGRALNAWARASGMTFLASAEVLSGRSTQGLTGTYPPHQALEALLRGTDLAYNVSGATVTIRNAGEGAATGGTVDDAIALDVITVSDGGNPVDRPFETAAPVAYISRETIERFRGSSPADIFRGTPGVMSGEARNGAGAVDVNIRGMQGFGRVATTIDGAENGVTVYQGYQGLSNRTYVDPDLLAGIEITKGSDVASRGIAGTVAMRTLDAGDIVKPGETWGVRVKGEFGTNSAEPEAGAKGGYLWPSTPSSTPVAVPSASGMDRPGTLDPRNGSASFAAGVKEENYDLFAAYAYRNRGNYFAGENGPGANPVNTGPRTVCGTYTCADWPEYVDNTGLTNYRAGEEALNTQLETESWITKATMRFGDGHSLQAGYTGYRAEAGDLLASRFTGERGQSTQQEQTAGTTVDTGTLRYRWDPDDNDLIDLKSNLWTTRLELRNPRRGSTIPTPESLGLPAGYRTGSDTVMWGADATNTSHLSFERYGSLDLVTGLSYLNEDTRPSDYSQALEGWLNLRDAAREEAAVFSKVAYQPLDWLTLNAGLRYSHYWSDDRSTNSNSAYVNPEPERDEGGFSPSVGVTVEPVDGAQLYVNYSNALRFPSLFEAGSAFTIIPNPDLKPERSSNWEIGANYVRDGLFSANDQGMLKFSYFNWDVKDYVTREFRAFQGDGYEWFGMQVYNIDRAKFAGLEFSARYENAGFTAAFGANYYLDIEYCRTADNCDSKTLYGDYATNHVPPEYMVNLTLSQKFLDDTLTLGGQVSYIGPRAIGHGQVTAQGAAQFITQINWDPYLLVDVFAEYKINENLTASIRVENLTDQYYVDPLGLVNQPGPGRTFYAGLTGTFGGDQPMPTLMPPLRGHERGVDWTGLYAGFHTGGVLAHIGGTTTTISGSPNSIAGTESANLDLRDNYLWGAQGGFNYQLTNGFVFGMEVDVSKTYLTGSQKALATEGTLAGTGMLQAETHYDIDLMSSIRGRIGYAFENGLFLYATGGAAFARENTTRDQYISDNAWGSDSFGTSTKIASTETIKLDRSGWTVGGGAEYAISDRWSIKADYSFTRLTAKAAEFSNARAGVGKDYTTTEQTGATIEPPDPFLCEILGGDFCLPTEIPTYMTTNHPGSSSVTDGRSASNSIDLHMVKIGLNYRF
ncbi:TonB-dependent receptor domain-containing protein [Ancylobacter sp.]|uniref:TonB-dependent receptor domain-containing protein n=1 Tax=Ancylobacter sp. TaxID=1872567 RepID=UPI003D14A0D8